MKRIRMIENEVRRLNKAKTCKHEYVKTDLVFDGKHTVYCCIKCGMGKLEPITKEA